MPAVSGPALRVEIQLADGAWFMIAESTASQKVGGRLIPKENPSHSDCNQSYSLGKTYKWHSNPNPTIEKKKYSQAPAITDLLGGGAVRSLTHGRSCT